jgi:hypothetical protein
MKNTVAIGIGLLGLSGFVLAAQTGDSQEMLVKDMLGTVDQINKILATVKDRETAEMARPDLKKNAEKMLELRKQADKWTEPNKAEKDRLAKEYAPKFEAAIKKLRDESLRVKSIPGGDQAIAELEVLKENQPDGKKDAAKDKKGG